MRSKYNIIGATVIAALAITGFAPKNKATMPWLSAAEATARWNQQKKPVIIDVYTSWCHYCRVMDNTTYKNDSLVNYVNDHFYAVKMDAESKDTVSWMGQNYQYIPQYKINELAIKLLNGRIVYPTTVIIPPDGGEPQAIPGALSAKELEIILKYFGEGKFGRVSWQDHEKQFVSTWK